MGYQSSTLKGRDLLVSSQWPCLWPWAWGRLSPTLVCPPGDTPVTGVMAAGKGGGPAGSTPLLFFS